MKRSRDKTRTIGTLPLLALVATLAGAPGTAYANSEESDTGRGEAPQWEVVTFESLSRMNDDTLFRLSRKHNVRIKGTMSRFAAYRVFRAFQFAPESTRQLVQKLNHAGSETAELRIVQDEIKATRQRNGVMSSFQSFPADKPGAAAYYDLLQNIHSSLLIEKDLRLLQIQEGQMPRPRRLRRIFGIY